MKGLIRQTVPPEFSGEPKPELLLVTWVPLKDRSWKPPPKLRLQGKRVGTLCFSQSGPLVPDQIVPFLTEAGEVIAVEGMLWDSFSRLIRRETGIHITRQVLRYDGLPITPEYNLEHLAG